MAPFKRPTPESIHLSTSPRHNQIYIEVCQRRGLRAVSDTEWPDELKPEYYDLWRFGPQIWKKVDVSFHHGYGQNIPQQRHEVELEWLGPFSVLDTTDDLTNLVLALNKKLPGISFVPWDMYDHEVMKVLIEMEPVGWFQWVWGITKDTFDRPETGIHFQHEADAVAFVGLTT